MHTKRNICGSQRLITAGISAFASFGEICEDFQTYEMRHPLRLAKTGLQNFGSDHQLQDSGLAPEFYFCLQANLHRKLVETSKKPDIIEPSIYRLQDGGLSVFLVP